MTVRYVKIARDEAQKTLEARIKEIAARQAAAGEKEAKLLQLSVNSVEGRSGDLKNYARKVKEEQLPVVKATAEEVSRKVR